MGSHRINALQFVTTLDVGGTERNVLDLTRALDRSRFEPHVSCLRCAGGFRGKIEALGVPLAEYRISRLYDFTAVGQRLRFAAYVRRNRIQVVHAYGFYSNVFAVPAARLARAPVVIASIYDMGDVWTPAQRRLEKVVCRLADCILVNAEAVRRRLVSEGYRAEKIAVIRNGTAFPKPVDGAGAKVRGELGLAASAPVVAVVSRVKPVKGIEHFLEAAAMVSGRFPDARFLVVGNGAGRGDAAERHSYRTGLEQYAARLGLDGRLLFTGVRLDVPELLSGVTVSVLPSLSEGLSNVLLEAMAAGVPVVATRVGGTPEVVEDGVTGLLVPPCDAAALADAICRMLADRNLASRFGKAGQQRVVEHFSVARMAGETESLYLELLRRAAKRGLLCR